MFVFVVCVLCKLESLRKLSALEARLDQFELSLCFAAREVVEVVVLWCDLQKPFSYKEKGLGLNHIEDE